MSANEANVKIVKGYKAPTQEGAYHRLLCLTGKNKGISYYLNGKRIVLGRSDKVDVQVLDTKSSREHAEMTFVNGQYVVTDLGSQNGIVINELKVSQHGLTDNDKIVIGSTVFKYNFIEVKPQMDLVEVEEEDDEEVEEVKEKNKKKSKANQNKKPKNKMMIYGIIALALVFLLPSEDGKKKEKAKVKKADTSNFDEFILNQNKAEDKDIEEKIDAIIHRGQREFREGNYFRAIEQFDIALTYSPNHGKASFYQNKSRQRLDEHIKEMFIKARKEAEQLKYVGSIKSYCAIVQYLQNYPEDDRYKEAEKNVEVLEQRLGMNPGDYKCF